MKSRPLLIQLLIEPKVFSRLNIADWDLLIRQARHANLLGRLAFRLSEKQILAEVPQQPRYHLESAMGVAERQAQAVRWEVNRIVQALDNLQTSIVLLKGAAYILQQLPAAQGRLFSDVDILVPKPQLEAVELALKIHGWVTTHLDAYDQRYYRDWMHELPPLRHLARETLLDVHHTILPVTARNHVDPKYLLESAISVAGFSSRVQVLASADILLHSATHLFHDGELNHGLRDLTDLDSLLRHFSAQDEAFWETLISRSLLLDLTRPLYYALRYTKQILDTPVPVATLRASQAAAPCWIMRPLMDVLFNRAFQPPHPSCSDWLTKPALWMLFVRAHWLKMPPWLLLRHLFHKTFVSPKDGVA